ncbi:riboflavin kinase [Zalerion maritima]|uniref:Riboflavin kinase n=1 Tax=Zalerion maritima TaxID=339359 RepID=A0AAD5RPS0_9PEZI|nr:riboflavin kinase [Zalerion maritima]
MTRPDLAGPDDGPVSPFPVCLSGKVIEGFGRGGKKVERPFDLDCNPWGILNCPTANLELPQTTLENLEFGVYFGWASLCLPSNHPDRRTPLRKRSRAESSAGANPLPDPSFPNLSADSSGVWALYPMVMSLGKNPFFNNKERSLEVHILHLFVQDFYGCDLRVMILGYIRPEANYESLEGLVNDIRIDCEVARRSLDRDGYSLKELTRATGRGKINGSWLVREADEKETSAWGVMMGKEGGITGELKKEEETGTGEA